MNKLEVLCATMYQNDFSLVEKMNINSDVVFANQSDMDCVQNCTWKNHSIRMITTKTRGVGLNRNISLIHSKGDILLFADDDMRYYDDYETTIIQEFDTYKDADVIIFNIDTNSDYRKQCVNKVTRRINRFSRLPYGAPRIAIRRCSWEKSNIWFTTLFGGGAKYTSGEDSIFIHALQSSGLTIYTSNKTIGIVNMDSSSWFNGRNEEYYFNKGAYSKSMYKKLCWAWKYYYCIRIKSTLSIGERFRNFNLGVKAFDEGLSYKDITNKCKI